MKKSLLNYIKLSIPFGMMLLLLQGKVFAQPFDDYSINLDTRRVTIEGSFHVTGSKRVAIRVVKENNTIDNVFIDTGITDGNGKYHYSFVMPDIPGTYILEAGLYSEGPYRKTFRYLTYNDLLGQVMNEKDANKLKSLAEEFYKNLKIDITDYSTLKTPVKVFESLITYHKYTDLEQFKNAFYKEVKVCQIREDSSVIKEYINAADDILEIKDKSFYKIFKDNSIMQEFVLIDLKEKTYNNYFEFINVFSESVILNGIYKPQNWSEVMTIIKENYEVIGVTAEQVNSGGEVFKSIANKKYDSLEKLKQAFLSALDKQQDVGNNRPSYNAGSSGPDKVISMDANLAGYVTNDSKPVAFIDIDSHFSKESVYKLYKKGVLAMSSDGKFRPDDNITREEFLKMLLESFNITDNQAQSDFIDVPKSHWSYKYIASAKNLKITYGINETTFGLGLNISREDMVTLLNRVICMKNIQLQSKVNAIVFNDEAEISNYALEAVRTMQTAGIVQGKGEKMFAPRSNATRGEAAKIICSLLENANILLGGE